MSQTPNIPRAVQRDSDDNTYYLDLTSNRAFEVGSFLLALMCYPDATNSKKQIDLSIFLYALMVRDRCARDPAWGSEDQILRPDYLFIDEGTAKSKVDTVRLRMERRVAAGRMVGPYLYRALYGETPELPPDMKKLSIEALAEHLAPSLDVSDPTHIVRKVWRDSLPIMHLCAAASDLLDRIQATKQPPELLVQFADARYLTALVAQAQAYEAFMAQRPLSMTPPKLIRIRIAGDWRAVRLLSPDVTG